MEKPAFLDDIKVKLSAIKDKVFAWIKENKKLAVIICTLILFMIVCIIVLLAISGKKDTAPKVFQDRLELTEDLVVPNGPELPGDYTISRETQEKWTEEEGSEYFTVPSDKEINGLSKANNKMIEEILGAAP